MNRIDSRPKCVYTADHPGCASSLGEAVSTHWSLHSSQQLPGLYSTLPRQFQSSPFFHFHLVSRAPWQPTVWLARKSPARATFRFSFTNGCPVSSHFFCLQMRSRTPWARLTRGLVRACHAGAPALPRRRVSLDETPRLTAGVFLSERQKRRNGGMIREEECSAALPQVSAEA